MTADRNTSAFAAEVGADGPVAVVGGRSRWEAGGPLGDDVRLVTAPQGVIEHCPEEMTVRVRAGTSVAELHDVLGRAGQRTSLPDRAGTVGGAVAVGENHLDVLARGTVRAAVLQLRYIAADGSVVTGGAPTVKNVSGFDLPRLMVGSLGTLGLFAEAVLRTNPVPPASLWLEAAGVDPFDIVVWLRRRATVLWDGERVRVHVEGHGVDVEAQRGALPGTWTEVPGPFDLPSHRWSLAPSALRALPPDTGPFVASVGVGTVWAAHPQPARLVDEQVLLLHRRAKAAFDPTARLNPGRDPLRR